MTVRQRPCPDCGDVIVTAAAPNGGRVALEPYPTPGGGRYRVDVLAHGLIVLTNAQRTSARTKMYDPHKCGPAKPTRRPEARPVQLALTMEDP